MIAHLRAIRRAITHILAQPLVSRPLLSEWEALLQYLAADMGYCQVERVRVLFLDTRCRLIRDELVSEGTIDQASVHVREVMRRALELGAASLILVHNHPSGCATPSRCDIELTRALDAAGKPLGVAVQDHLIIAGTQHVSLRAKGLLR